MIEIRDLQFAYPGEGFGLQVGEMVVGEGERVAWVGPSGSGKTTLLNLLAGIELPQVGSVKCCGKSVSEMPEAERRDFRISNLGLVFQDFALLDYLTVLNNILLPYRINRSLRFNEGARDRAVELAEQVGVSSYLERRPEELSQGERQRVAVCRALVTEPSVVLADEPTANLDAENRGRVMDALEQYAGEKNATLVVVTHDDQVMGQMERVIEVSAFCQQFQAVGGAADGR